MIREVSTLAPLFPLIVGFRKRWGSVIWWYCLFSLVTDLVTYYLRWELHISNALPGNLFALIEFCCILFFYKNKVFHRNTLFYMVLLCGCLFFLGSTTFGMGWMQLNRIGISLFLITYILLGLIGFYTLIKEPQHTFIAQSSFFWANTALFLFAAGAFFFFLATAHIRTSTDKKALGQLWATLFQMINILKNVLLGLALIKKQER
jgi:hypothetical protein